MADVVLEDVWRHETPHVLAALVRHYGDFGRCEDAVQEALAAAATSWPGDGIPDHPRGWLIRTASRRLLDTLRSDRARTERELRVVESDPSRINPDHVDPGRAADDQDDSLKLLLLCCHPDLSSASQVALTLRAVGGLTTEQIAAGFLVPTSTIAQRISRAKRSLRTAGVGLGEVAADDLPERVESVRQVLYLIFNEGYTSSAGDDLIDVSLTTEAIRLTRELHRRLPHDTETAGLLALMLLTAARAPARADPAGDLIPLADQDRARWDQDRIAEGTTIIEAALPTGAVGPFQLQAAIAAVHDEAADYAATDWPQIAELYRMLDDIAPGPAVTLNRAVAVAMTDGPQAGLALLEDLLQQRSMSSHHRVIAVRAHLLEQLGDIAAARESYSEAARLTASIPEQRYLHARAARVTGDGDTGPLTGDR